jgi:RHS repeat-associated protein
MPKAKSICVDSVKGGTNVQSSVISLSKEDLLLKIIKFYTQQLQFSEEAKTFLEKRELTIKEVVSQFQMGYSTGELNSFLREDELILGLAKELGVLDSKGCEYFENHLVIPIYDDEKKVVDLEGLNLETGQKKRLINKSSKKHIFDSIVTEIKTTRDDLEKIVKEKYDLKHIEKKSGKLGITVKVSDPKQPRFILDTINLFSEKQRRGLCEQVANMFGQCEADVESALFCLMELIETGKMNVSSDLSEVVITEKEKRDAMIFLSAENLFENLLIDLDQLGYIGEEVNKQLGYLAMTSRKTQNPLSLIIMSTSAAGKSTLQKTMFDCCPPEERKHFTRLTPQSLYYLGDESIKHKFLSIEEEEGSNEAGYALKILLSAKSINISTTGQDPNTGARQTNELKTEGPVSVIVSTTKSDVEPELASRALIVTIDESKEQTLKIMGAQRISRTLEGRLKNKKQEEIKKKHHTIQRLLRTDLTIVNNLSESIIFPDDRLKYRRGHEQYLNLIDAVAFFRQYQKEIKNEPEFGSYYFNHRWYDPASMRFLSKDPAPIDPNDPRTINRYTFVFNNPNRYVDPDGKYPMAIPGISFSSDSFSAIIGDNWDPTSKIFSVNGNLARTDTLSVLGYNFSTKLDFRNFGFDLSGHVLKGNYDLFSAGTRNLGFESSSSFSLVEGKLGWGSSNFQKPGISALGTLFKAGGTGALSLSGERLGFDGDFGIGLGFSLETLGDGFKFSNYQGIGSGLGLSWDQSTLQSN